MVTTGDPHGSPIIPIGNLQSESDDWGARFSPNIPWRYDKQQKKGCFPRKIPRNRRNWDLPGWIVESPSGQSCIDFHLGRPPSPSREWFQKPIRGHPLRSTSIYQEMFIHQSQTSRFLMLVTMKNGSPIINGLWESPFFLSSMVPTYNNQPTHHLSRMTRISMIYVWWFKTIYKLHLHISIPV